MVGAAGEGAYSDRARFWSVPSRLLPDAHIRYEGVLLSFGAVF